MRLVTVAVSLASAVALVGCDGGAEHAWDGPPDPGPDGVVAVDGFAEHQESVDEAWEGSAAMAAAEFLRLDERTASRTTIAATAPAEGAGPETVVVTLDGLLDDSVRAERWTLAFEPDGDGYRLTSARWTQRCQPGRGHQAFSASACV
ncbi:MAG: hypothetical protein ACRDNY_00950 [Gaiellaceae bacterium]